MSDWMDEANAASKQSLKDMYDEQCGGLHPEEVCGLDCSGCCAPWEWK